MLSQSVNTGVGLTGLMTGWKDWVLLEQHWCRTHRTDDWMERLGGFGTTLV